MWARRRLCVGCLFVTCKIITNLDSKQGHASGLLPSVLRFLSYYFLFCMKHSKNCGNLAVIYSDFP